ncbi:MAG: sigma-70 family RNA polymerase sigma factor [Chitinophagales bacterium]|nr:sigma-70 family RNA polymerase sigma factor [Chitinophagales bacterium]
MNVDKDKIIKESIVIIKTYMPKYRRKARIKFPSLSDEVVKDIFNEAVLKFLVKRNNGYYEDKGQLQAFVFKIADGLLINKFKETALKAEKTDLVQLLTNANAIDKERLEHIQFFLHKAIGNLKEDEKKIINLYYIYGYTDEVIAQHLETSPSAAKMRRHYALSKLRKQLEGKKNLFL